MLSATSLNVRQLNKINPLFLTENGYHQSLYLFFIMFLKKYRFCLLFLLATLNYSTLKAQALEVGAGGGVTHYKGDLSPRFKPFMLNGGANAFVRYNLSDAVSVKATGMIGVISAKDKKVNEVFFQERDFSFKTSLWEAGVQFEYNFLNFRSPRALYASNWTPYVFGGVNFYKFIKRTLETTNPNLGYNRIETEGTLSYSLPFGVGFKKALTYNLNLNVEFGTRKTWSDLELDLMGYYKDNTPYYFQTTANGQTIPNSIEEARFGSHLTHKKDMYYYTNISISYVFNKVHCPPGGKRRFIFF